MRWLIIQTLYACVHQAPLTPTIHAEEVELSALHFGAVELARGIGDPVEVSCASDQMAVVLADRTSVTKVSELAPGSATSDVFAPVVVLSENGEVVGLSFRRKLISSDGGLYGEAFSGSPDGRWIFVIRHTGPLFALKVEGREGATAVRFDFPVPGMMVRSVVWTTPSTVIVAAESSVVRIILGGETPSVEIWPVTSRLATGGDAGRVWTVRGGYGQWDVTSMGGSDSREVAEWSLPGASTPLALKVLSGEPFVLTSDGTLWRRGIAVPELLGLKVADDGESVTSFCLSEDSSGRRTYFLVEKADSWRVLMVPLIRG